MTDLEAFRRLAQLDLAPELQAWCAEGQRRAQVAEWARRRPSTGSRLAGINDAGRVVGEDHHRSKLSDSDIALMFDLRAAGLSYQQIADKFDDGVRVARSTVADILTGRRRSHMVTGQRRVATFDPVFYPAAADEFDVVYA